MRALKILLVEDDVDHVFLIRRALADLPDAAVTVEVVGDGEQAIEHLARSRFEPGGPAPAGPARPQDAPHGRPRGAGPHPGRRGHPPGGGADLLGAPGGPRGGPAPGATWFVCKPTDGRRFRSEIQQLGDRWARHTA